MNGQSPLMRERQPWQPGEKLKLLFAGYNGRAIWVDVRVEEMLRQIRHISARTGRAQRDEQNFEFTRLFAGTAQVQSARHFPPFLSAGAPPSRRGGLRRLDVQK